MEFLKTCNTNAQAIVRRETMMRDGALTVRRETSRLSHIKPSQSPAPPPPLPRQHRETGTPPKTYAQSRPSCNTTLAMAVQAHDCREDRADRCPSPGARRLPPAQYVAFTCFQNLQLTHDRRAGRMCQSHRSRAATHAPGQPQYFQQLSIGNSTTKGLACWRETITGQ
jgi:hypothetical protein